MQFSIILCLLSGGDSVGQPSGTGVQPPIYAPVNQMPPFPIYVIPYPLPIVPSPSSCPCYLLQPGKNDSTAVSQQGQGYPVNQGYAPYGIIGFIPVVFVPNCPGNTTDMHTAQQNFPSAVPVPYNCAQCQANRGLYRYRGRLNGARNVNDLKMNDLKLNDLREIRTLSELETLLKDQIKPTSHPATQPLVKTTSNTSEQPESEAASKPESETVSKTDSKPASKPESKPDSDVPSEPTSHPRKIVRRKLIKDVKTSKTGGTLS